MDIETIYKEYFSVVYGYILSISGDPLTAEEITQETFFKALKKIDDFRGESSLKVWLCQIAKNTFYNYEKARRKIVEMPKNYDESIAYPEDDYLITYESKRAHIILHNMREPYKEVFSLRTFGELSFSDIGELFGKSDSWARVTYYRAKAMLKEEMENDKDYL